MRHIVIPSLLAVVCQCSFTPTFSAESTVETTTEHSVEALQTQLTSLRNKQQAARTKLNDLRKETLTIPELAALQDAYVLKEKEFRSFESTDENLKAARTKEAEARSALDTLVKQKQAEHIEGSKLLAQLSEIRQQRRMMEFEREVAHLRMTNRYSPIYTQAEQEPHVASLKKTYDAARRSYERQPSEAVVTAKSDYEAARTAYETLIAAEPIQQAREIMLAAKKAYDATRAESPEATAYKQARAAYEAARQEARSKMADAEPYTQALATINDKRSANDQARRQIESSLRDLYRTIERGDDPDIQAAQEIRASMRKAREEVYEVGILGEAKTARDSAKKALDTKLKETLNDNPSFVEAYQQERTLGKEMRTIEKKIRQQQQ